MTEPTATDPGSVVTLGRGARFGRIGRVVPIAIVQIVGTVVASHWAGSVAAGGPGPGPGAIRGSMSGGPIDAVTLTPLAVGLLVLGCVVLPFRWRWPVAVLGAVLVTNVAFGVVVSPRGPFVAALTMALVNAVIRGHRVPTLVAAGIAFVVLPWSDVLTGRSTAVPWVSMTMAAAWLIAAIAVAELVRVRMLRRAEARRAREAEEHRRADDERVRIARELHDSVAHTMSLINLQSGVALHLGSDLPESTQAALQTIRDASREALVELRAILGVLRTNTAAGGGSGLAGSSPDARESGAADEDRAPVPGLDRLPDLVARARAAGLDITLDVEGDLGAMAKIVDRTAFRIAQESVTNIMKHAPKNRAEVVIRTTEDAVELEITDHPAPPSARLVHTEQAEQTERRSGPLLGASGNGIIGMRERASAAGGELRAGPSSDGGWTVHARLPRIEEA